MLSDNPELTGWSVVGASEGGSSGTLGALAPPPDTPDGFMLSTPIGGTSTGVPLDSPPAMMNLSDVGSDSPPQGGGDRLEPIANPMEMDSSPPPASYQGKVPKGVIVMWYGTAAAVPIGWHLCDGSTVNGVVTPDLRDRFIVGAHPDHDGDSDNDYLGMTPHYAKGDTGGKNWAGSERDNNPIYPADDYGGAWTSWPANDLLETNIEDDSTEVDNNKDGSTVSVGALNHHHMINTAAPNGHYKFRGVWTHNVAGAYDTDAGDITSAEMENRPAFRAIYFICKVT